LVVPRIIDVERQLAAFREIKDPYIKANNPAWTILAVAAQARPTLFRRDQGRGCGTRRVTGREISSGRPQSQSADIDPE
jgi:hypothetical protein